MGSSDVKALTAGKQRKPGRASLAEIERQARALARTHKEAEPAIERVLWFPSEKEIRLVEMEAETVPALSGRVEPFFFGPARKDGLTVPSGLAIIQTKEYGRLKLPRGWGSWSQAVDLEV